MEDDNKGKFKCMCYGHILEHSYEPDERVHNLSFWTHGAGGDRPSLWRRIKVLWNILIGRHADAFWGVILDEETAQALAHHIIDNSQTAELKREVERKANEGWNDYRETLFNASEKKNQSATGAVYASDYQSNSTHRTQLDSNYTKDRVVEDVAQGLKDLENEDDFKADAPLDLDNFLKDMEPPRVKEEGEPRRYTTFWNGEKMIVEIMDPIADYDMSMLAKKKGFHVPVNCSYGETPVAAGTFTFFAEPGDQFGTPYEPDDYNAPKWSFKKCSAPTYPLLMRWLRDYHGLDVRPVASKAGKWKANVYNLKDEGNLVITTQRFVHEKYEHASEAGILASLNKLPDVE